MSHLDNATDAVIQSCLCPAVKCLRTDGICPVNLVKGLISNILDGLKLKQLQYKSCDYLKEMNAFRTLLQYYFCYSDQTCNLVINSNSHYTQLKLVKETIR